jgi:hypothetical protein
MIPVTEPRSWFTPQDRPSSEDPVSGAGTEQPMETPEGDRFVRPFMVTEGRTRPLRDDLRIETMVRTVPAALSAPLRFEQYKVVQLCQVPMSLAEIGAVLRVPLGVARVLVGDLLAGNYVEIREPTELPTHVIERIRDLVRAL